jgi:hypothetical protein
MISAGVFGKAIRNHQETGQKSRREAVFGAKPGRNGLAREFGKNYLVS